MITMTFSVQNGTQTLDFSSAVSLNNTSAQRLVAYLDAQYRTSEDQTNEELLENLWQAFLKDLKKQVKRNEAQQAVLDVPEFEVTQP